MPARYSPVGGEDVSNEQRNSEAFSDIETSSVIDNKDLEGSKPRYRQNLRPVAITILLQTIFILAILGIWSALHTKFPERQSPVPNRESEPQI